MSSHSRANGPACRVRVVLTDMFRRLEDRLSPTEILCLGIGRLSSSAAREQLAFLLALRDAMGSRISRTTVYDPLFAAEDTAVLARLEMTLPASNKCGAYALDQRTVIYMPHCPKELYESLLRSNWSVRLQSLAICGNDLEEYSMGDLSAYPCIQRIRA